MEISVIVFPGSNCDRDIAVSLKKVFKRNPKMVWHKEQTLPKSDLIILPGGFSYGDYLRCGSMAANSPIMSEIIKCGENGTFIIGICNGFQILTNIIIPLCKPGIIIGSIFVITVVMGDFLTIGIMGGQQIASIGKIIQVEMSYLQLPAAAANAVILLFITLLLIWTMTKFIDIRKEL